MERLTDKNAKYDYQCEPVEGMQWINDALNRLAAYEDTGLTPEEIKSGINDATDLARIAIALRKLRRYEYAEQEGRLVVLDNQTALAIAAGARAIGTNRRCEGATYVYDIFSEEGGPYEIPYAAARKILFEIWQTCPLVPAQQTEPEGVE